jgi:hypothetical protein
LVSLLPLLPLMTMYLCFLTRPLVLLASWSLQWVQGKLVWAELLLALPQAVVPLVVLAQVQVALLPGSQSHLAGSQD